MSDKQCTCGMNWRDDYCPRHGLYHPSKKREHELEAEVKRLKKKLEAKP
jgi:hypothetical protein